MNPKHSTLDVVSQFLTGGENHYFLAATWLTQPSTWLAFVTVNPHSTAHPPEPKVLPQQTVLWPVCTAAHGSSIHPWGTISYFSSTSHTRLLLYQATSPGPTEGWLLPADWTTWYHPNKLDEITLKPTIHPIKRYQMALIPKLILEGTGATCNQMPAGLCFIDPPILCWPPTLQIPYLVHLSPAGTEGSQSTPCLRSDSPTVSCLAGSYLQYHTDF